MNGGEVESIVGLFVPYIYCDHKLRGLIIAARDENVYLHKQYERHIGLSKEEVFKHCCGVSKQTKGLKIHIIMIYSFKHWLETK